MPQNWQVPSSSSSLVDRVPFVRETVSETPVVGSLAVPNRFERSVFPRGCAPPSDRDEDWA